MNTTQVFSGSSNLPLVEKIWDNLEKSFGRIVRGEVFLKAFPSGERYCQFKQSIRGNDVFLIQSTSNPVNDNLMELLVMCDAARRASAERITAVISYFGYARQDRKDKSRIPISAKLVMDLLQSAGADRILTMDLHSPQSVGFTNMPVDQLGFRPVLVNAIKDLGIEVVVSPDIGAVKRAEEYASALKTDLTIISKKRCGDTEVKINNFIGNVENKRVIIIDDLTESCGTLIEAATACREQGAKEVFVAVTHGCFTDIGYKRLTQAFDDNLIDRLFISNSVDIKYKWDKLSIVDVSHLFAEAICNIATNQSVSKLF